MINNGELVVQGDKSLKLSKNITKDQGQLRSFLQILSDMNEDPNTCFNLREELDDLSLSKDYANNKIARQITISDILSNEEQQPFAYQKGGVYDQRTQ